MALMWVSCIPARRATWPLASIHGALYFSVDQATHYFGSLSLVFVPEPSTTLLMGLGLAPLAVRRRTKSELCLKGLDPQGPAAPIQPPDRREDHRQYGEDDC
jgi:hypothetical protein